MTPLPELVPCARCQKREARLTDVVLEAARAENALRRKQGLEPKRKSQVALCAACAAEHRDELMERTRQVAMADGFQWRRYLKHEITREELLAKVSDREAYRRAADELERRIKNWAQRQEAGKETK